ncbi:MAG: HGGxSTG domain-containing protein [Alphaproteobacteria bacterium]
MSKLNFGKCGARRKYDGQPCQAPARANGRCKLHGGLSTGPATEEGRRRISEAQKARWARFRLKAAEAAI